MVFMDGHSNRKAETPQGPGTARLSDVTERSGGETDPAWWGLGGGGPSRLWQLREPGVLTSQQLGCSWSLLKSEPAHPQQISRLHSGTEILSPSQSVSPVPGTRRVLKDAG